MSKIFWGYFFVFINFHLNMNGHSVNILPPFIGYILLVQGMRLMERESEMFRHIRPFAAGMAVYSGIVWVGALLGVTSDNWLGSLLALISSLVSLYISWAFIQAVRDVEFRREADLNGASMQKIWYAMTAVALLSDFLSLMLWLCVRYWSTMDPISFADSALAAVHIILAGAIALAWLAAAIVFLIAVWKSKELYGELPPLEFPEPEEF